MKLYKQSQMESIVKEIVSKYDLTYPINSEDIIYKLNGTIKEDAIDKPYIELTKDGFIVHLKNVDNCFKRNEELATSIGHIFLNFDILKSGKFNDLYRTFRFHSYITQAERFGIYLLLPEKEIRNEIAYAEKKTVRSVQRMISEKFKVTEDTAYFRLKCLGIVDMNHTYGSIF